MKKILITGANKRIGFETAKQVTAAGCLEMYWAQDMHNRYFRLWVGV